MLYSSFVVLARKHPLPGFSLACVLSLRRTPSTELTPKVQLNEGRDKGRMVSFPALFGKFFQPLYPLLAKEGMKVAASLVAAVVHYEFPIYKS